MKKILFIYPKAALSNYNACSHSGWTKDCSDSYVIHYWGLGWGNTAKKSLLRKLKKMKPDYIYLTVRKRYLGWLPSLADIDIPKIFVECDVWNYRADDPWYSQFSKVLCRQPWWGKNSRQYSSKMGDFATFERRIENSETWAKVPHFKWSVSKYSFANIDPASREHVAFVGGYRSRTGVYEVRRLMSEALKNEVVFTPIPGEILPQDKYWEFLRKCKVLICPTESGYGDFVPAKMFEYGVAGACILTNCDLIRYGMPDLDSVCVKYSSLDDLRYKLKQDHSSKIGKATEIMKNHIHEKRYAEIFCGGAE